MLAALIAYVYYFAWLDIPILHDAAGYLRAAQDILNKGLFSKYDMSDLRTYAWPFLLSGLVKLSNYTGVPLRLLAFHFELAFHLAACLGLRRALRAAGLAPGLATLVFLSVVLNPLVLIYPSYLLTESCSFSSLILLAAASIWFMFSSGKTSLGWIAAAGSALLGISIMIRPGNICMLPVWAGAMTIGFFLHRPGAAKILAICALALLFLVLPMIPQLVNNITYYGHVSLLVANDFSQGGRWLGVRCIKYATSYIGNDDPQVFYENPFHANEPLSFTNPLAWYRQNPLKGAATIGLHLFNLLDQDLPFPYNTTLTPRYYPAAAIANMFVVACGCIGLWISGRLALRSVRKIRIIYLIALTMLASVLAMYMFFAAETRWGVPALMVLYVFAAWLIAGWMPGARSLQRIVVLLVACGLTSAAYPLSRWVRQHAPAIRAAEQFNRDAALVPKVMQTIAPGRPFVSPGLNNWTLVQAGVGEEGEAILFVSKPGELSGLLHPVILERSTGYHVEFDARAVAAITSELSVDLYAGPSYDHNEQNSMFNAIGKTFGHFTADWNSGPDAPRDALLRFVTVSTRPIQVKNIVFRKIGSGK